MVNVIILWRIQLYTTFVSFCPVTRKELNGMEKYGINVSQILRASQAVPDQDLEIRGGGVVGGSGHPDP